MAGRDRNGACSSWLCTLALTAGFLGLRFFLPGVSNSPHGACPVLLAGADDAGLEVFVHVQSGLLPQALGGVEENGTHPFLALSRHRAAPGGAGGWGWGADHPEAAGLAGRQGWAQARSGAASSRPTPSAARSPTWPWLLPGAAPSGRGPSAPAPECSSCLRPCGAP